VKWRSKPTPPPIGIAVTTLNRRRLLKRTLRRIAFHTPAGVPVVVVDDGSDRPYRRADHRNDTPQGVANAKNHCLRLLMANPAVQHLFLFDDDCHPTRRNWWKPYVDSPEQHLAYLHSNLDPAAHTVVYDDGEIVATERGTACMLYFTRAAIDTVGGFRPVYGRWSYEHDDLTYRLMNTGVTRFPYQGLAKNRGIWNLDEHVHGRSSLSREERTPMREANRLLFEQYRWSTDYVPYDDRSV